MSLLSRDDILREMKTGGIEIDPFIPENLGTNSYDLRLASAFFWVGPEETFWGPVFIRHGEYVHIPSGGTVLGHSIERVNSDGIIVSLQARSTVGRCGMTVCRDAGFGDNHYNNLWTLELTGYIIGGNARWRVGDTIAQAVFERLETNTDNYAGQYTIMDWPTCMVPKKFRDRIYPAKQWMVDWLTDGTRMSGVYYEHLSENSF